MRFRHLHWLKHRGCDPAEHTNTIVELVELVLDLELEVLRLKCRVAALEAGEKSVIFGASTSLGEPTMPHSFPFSTSTVTGTDEGGVAFTRPPTAADGLAYALADPATGGAVTVGADGVSGSIDQGAAADGVGFVLNTLFHGNVVGTSNGTWAGVNITAATTALGTEVDA